MLASARTIFAFGIVLLLEGLVLLVIPNQFLVRINLPATDEPWIRLLGIALIALGWYYLGAARRNLVDFFRWSVQGRTAQLGLFLILVALGVVPPILLIFSGLEFAAGLWTAVNLAKDRFRF